MSDTVIRVENLSKHYRLGVIGSNTLRDDVARKGVSHELYEPTSGHVKV